MQPFLVGSLRLHPLTPPFNFTTQYVSEGDKAEDSHSPEVSGILPFILLRVHYA